MTRAPKRPENPLNDGQVLGHAFGGDEGQLFGEARDEMPESLVWQGLCEALRRKAPVTALVGRLAGLLEERRSGAPHPVRDAYPDDATLAPTVSVGKAWSAYKAAVVARDWAGAQRALEGLREKLL